MNGAPLLQSFCRPRQRRDGREYQFLMDDVLNEAGNGKRRPVSSVHFLDWVCAIERANSILSLPSLLRWNERVWECTWLGETSSVSSDSRDRKVTTFDYKRMDRWLCLGERTVESSRWSHYRQFFIIGTHSGWVSGWWISDWYNNRWAAAVIVEWRSQVE